MPLVDLPCPVVSEAADATPVGGIKTLTQNQKKKRRHKLAKLGARQQVSFSHADSSFSDCTLGPAASEASTTAFASLSQGRQALSSRASVAGLAADLMATVTAEDLTAAAEPSVTTADSDAMASSAGLVTHTKQAKAASAQVSSTWSEAAASCTSIQDPTGQTQDHANTASLATAPPSSQLPTHTVDSGLIASAKCRPSSLICRTDMSAAALAVHASFAPQAVHTSTASPPTTDAHEAEPPAAKKQKRVFIHGNYNRYYGYRLGSELEEDPRLQVLDRRWFYGKRCLDIGCNEGVITLAAVQRFAPLSMLGVDIDEGLIKTACRALSKQRTEASALHQRLTRHTSSAELGDRPAAQRKAAAAAVRAFANVWFTCEDFASSQHTPQSLDTVMCLSVTKWVHLNQGDGGLKKMFAKVKEALVPGGWFILEPQPWRSYQQARRKQDISAAPFARLDMLELRPEAFPEYLEEELGFVLARELHVATSSAGFNRPMYLFQRGM